MKKRIFPFILAVIAVMSSCGNTASDTTKETATKSTESNINETGSEQLTETTTTVAETTATTETTTTAPVIEPIIEHEMLPMQEAFIKVVENDAQEKVKEITEYSNEDRVYKVAVTESGTEYVLINYLYIYEILYDNNALIDINNLHTVNTADFDWYGYSKVVECINNELNLTDSSEEMTISQMLSRNIGADISVESIECDEIMNTCMLTCNHGIRISCRGLLDPDIEHKYHIDENDKLVLDTSFHDEYADAYLLPYISELHEEKGNTALTGSWDN